jgi:hypothetical protein
MSEPKASLDRSGPLGQRNGEVNTIPDNDELAHFREAWRAEIKHRKQVEQGGLAAVENPSNTDGKRPLENVIAPSLGGVTPLGFAPVPLHDVLSPEVSRALPVRVSMLSKARTDFTSTQVRYSHAHTIELN